VVVGLALTLAGLFLTLKHDPPVLDFGEEFAKRSKMSYAEQVNDWENSARKEKIKIQLSKGGVWLIVSGTFLQLAGTVWQVIRLAG
jgi:hypothetical protein